MLAFRRLLAFSSRVHTYLLTLYSFFALLFALSLYFPLSEEFMVMVSMCRTALGWTILLEGGWVIAASLWQSLASRVLCLHPVLFTLLRTAVYFLLSTLLDILNSVIMHGFSYSGGL